MYALPLHLMPSNEWRKKIIILRTDRWYWLIWYQHKKSKPLKLPQWWRKWEQQQKLIATNSKTRHYKIKWNEHQLITLCVSMKNCNQCFYDLFTLNSHLYEWASWLHIWEWRLWKSWEMLHSEHLWLCSTIESRAN